MVSDLSLAPYFLGSQESWSPTNLVPNKFGPGMKIPYNDFNAGNKFLGAQKFQGPVLSVLAQNV